VEVFLSFILLLVGFFLIVKGGDFLVRSALQISRLSGLPTVIVGATFVSLATTLPEIVISIYAILTQHQALAVGNAIGGMLVSLALIFALYATILPQRVSKHQLLPKSIFLFLSIALVITFSVDGRISMVEGFILGLIYFLYLALTAKQPRAPVSVSAKTITPPEGEEVRLKAVARGFLIGQFLLLFGAFLLVQNSERLALGLGVSETVVGFTLVALGTSMPEFVTVIKSIKHKSSDLAIGSIIGSNIINATLLLGICAVVGSLHNSPLAISHHTLFVAIPILIIASLISVVPVLIKGRTYRSQGVALLFLYATYIALLFLL